MSRLGKKCFIVSSGLHALLVVILLVSPAFRPKEEQKITPPVRVIDGAVIAAIMNAGAATPRETPVARPSAPTPTPVAKSAPKKPADPPKPDPKPEPKPDPKPTPKPKPIVKPPPKVVKPVPKVVKTVPKTTPKPKPRTVKVASLDKLISRSDSSAEKRKREADEKKRRDAAKHAEDDRKRALAKLDSLIGGVKFSSQVNFKSAGGGSSRATMDYGSYIVQTYDRQWREPSQMAGSRQTAEVTVTIRRDGSVSAVRISRRSGVGALDNSIQDLIDSVRRFRPFPSGMDESSKTFTIDFSVRAK